MFSSEVEGILQFDAYEGRTNGRLECSSVYSLAGVFLSCADCIWDVSFALDKISDDCVYNELEELRFRVESDQWLVLEDTGWELWGEAEESGDAVWSLRSLYALLP